MTRQAIIFSGDSVRAILDGKKTQTRRVIQWPRAASFHGRRAMPDKSFVNTGVAGEGNLYLSAAYGGGDYPPDEVIIQRVFSPYGYAGEKLWVRETWYDDFQNGAQEIAGIYYRADGEAREQFEDLEGFAWRPSIFMPRWASRITIEITGVRVERLQAITEEDAKAEGVERDASAFQPTYKAKFCELWESINGKRAPWNLNPWVWVIEFERANDVDEDRVDE